MQAEPHGQTFPLSDTNGLTAPNLKIEAAKYLGRKSVRTMEGKRRRRDFSSYQYESTPRALIFFTIFWSNVATAS